MSLLYNHPVLVSICSSLPFLRNVLVLLTWNRLSLHKVRPCDVRILLISCLSALVRSYFFHLFLLHDSWYSRNRHWIILITHQMSLSYLLTRLTSLHEPRTCLICSWNMLLSMEVDVSTVLSIIFIVGSLVIVKFMTVNIIW